VENKYFLPVPGIESVQPVARRYTDGAIPANQLSLVLGFHGNELLILILFLDCCTVWQ
jgi:hypothetical protein